GSVAGGRGKGIGANLSCGICHSWSEDGRCISLLKILYTNECVFDCAYCVNRRSRDIPRASFTPEELADLTISFYKRNYIEGLFLSSGVKVSPNHTMEELVAVLRLLREKHGFHGYIHVKVIPGADFRLIALAGGYANRISVNMELPSEKYLTLLAPQKKREAIIKPMHFIAEKLREKTAGKKARLARTRLADHPFAVTGQSTQLIVGASPDSDYSIIKLSESLYQNYGLKRVYYSAYVPVNSSPYLPDSYRPPLLREHRLYQADWLLRYYGFNSGEIVNPGGNLELDLDPKCAWALNNLSFFPVEINKADYRVLLKVPGIGPKSARRIMAARRFGPLTFDALKTIGVVLKRARYFITCQGKYYGGNYLDSALLRETLTEKARDTLEAGGQLTLFSPEYKQKESLLLPQAGGHGINGTNYL
ncbi:MAG TPA: putative DNA modification/repair radical SAM protein, partial [Firmicutes bacterium]|nr:putative DNA modification/repair radical SAM protein [Bacillota bacterium]